jgi:hypothetical protein
LVEGRGWSGVELSSHLSGGGVQGGHPCLCRLLAVEDAVGDQVPGVPQTNPVAGAVVLNPSHHLSCNVTVKQSDCEGIACEDPRLALLLQEPSLHGPVASTHRVAGAGRDKKNRPGLGSRPPAWPCGSWRSSSWSRPRRSLLTPEILGGRRRGSS